MTGGMEKHIMGILQAVIIGLLAWVGASTVQVREAVVELQTQMRDVVVRRMDAQDAVITDHERRIRELERQR